MNAAEIDDKKVFEDDEEPASSIRPITPSSSTPSSSGVAIGTIRPSTMRPPQSSVTVTVSVALGPSLLAICCADGWYATITRLDGTVLHEGSLEASGSMEALVAVPPGTESVKVLIESSTKYKDAIVRVGDDGIAAHTFV